MDWKNLTSYLLYCFFHYIYRWIQENIVRRPAGISPKNLETSSESCQTFKILYRKKLVPVDLAQSTDFVCYHETFADPKVLFSDPRWTLYSMDKDYVYFIQMPEPFHFYNAQKAPLLYVTQFYEGQKLARISLRAFCELSDKILQNPVGRVVFYTNAGRSGSTLLTRLLQACGEQNIVCFSEPDVFTVISILLQHHLLDESTTIAVLKASLRFICRHQPPDITYFIKTRSNCVRLVPFVKSALPEVKHMFTFRKNAGRTITSLAKLMWKGGGDVVVFHARLSPWLAFKLVAIANYEYEMCKKFGFRDCVGLSMVAYVSSYYHYWTHKDMYDIPMVLYEDLVREPRAVMRPIFQLCNLPFEQLIETSMQEMQLDSQGGTTVSQEALKDVRVEEFDDKRVKKLKLMFEALSLPKVWLEE